ncbi:hypothetical protein FM038_003850 [Shewanella eurypsychrophilus]|uniref:DUF4124 domain-containing protein n=1 Tax=Shewanella eurypsychrophilus TaxID=2593656 RepID=A0ABX6V292_9GAMM|nr:MULTISPECIES: hypothetical protein [Shewanella]QFU21362.1 hypothetical protein FS418_05430 [Shewanella sp. YLB-09]QPG56652.1 hypothetical protein FM038_003850 [Shewanella eurypsychrophilus]
MKQQLIVFGLLAISVLFSQVSHAKVYQCEVDGKMVFQDHLCEAVESQTEIAIIENIKSDFNDEERKLINSNDVAIGMSEKALVKSRGEPDAVHRSGRGGEQWLYQGEEGRMLQVIMKDGKVYDWRD